MLLLISKFIMHEYVKLASSAIETFVKTQRVIIPPKSCSSHCFSQRSGVFVTIKRDHQLRGCIGTYLPTQKNLAEEIIHSAIAAATEDPRFSPIQIKELPKLNYEVSILSPPEEVKNLKELDPKRYGIMVKDKIGKVGLLLPSLSEVKTGGQQIAIACQKAGIDSQTNKISVYKFKAQQYSDDD